MVEAFYTKGIKYSYEDIIRGKKITRKGVKKEGQFNTKFTTYCEKDIRGNYSGEFLRGITSVFPAKI